MQRTLADQQGGGDYMQATPSLPCRNQQPASMPAAGEFPILYRWHSPPRSITAGKPRRETGELAGRRFATSIIDAGGEEGGEWRCRVG